MNYIIIILIVFVIIGILMMMIIPMVAKLTYKKTFYCYVNKKSGKGKCSKQYEYCKSFPNIIKPDYLTQ